MLVALLLVFKFDLGVFLRFVLLAALPNLELFIAVPLFGVLKPEFVFVNGAFLVLSLFKVDDYTVEGFFYIFEAVLTLLFTGGTSFFYYFFGNWALTVEVNFDGALVKFVVEVVLPFFVS